MLILDIYKPEKTHLTTVKSLCCQQSCFQSSKEMVGTLTLSKIFHGLKIGDSVHRVEKLV